MANTSKFAFQAPNPAALDPSVLEQVYAGGAARKMGPAFNLVAANLAGGDRRDASNAYLANISDLNRRAQEAGMAQLQSERLQELIKQGVELMKSDPTFSALPLAQFAGTMGQGGSEGLLAFLANMGAQNNAAKRVEQIGKGYGDAAAQGLRITGGVQSFDQVPFTPLTQGTPTSVMAAGVGTKMPKMITTYDAAGNAVTRYETPIDPAQLPANARPGANPQVEQGNMTTQAQAARLIGQSDAAKFVGELGKQGISLPPNTKFEKGTATINGQTVNGAIAFTLPNGQRKIWANGKIVDAPVSK